MKKLTILLLVSFCSVAWSNIQFDGTDDLVNCGDWAAVQSMAQMTVAVWLYPHTCDTSYRHLVSKYEDAVEGWTVVLTDSWNSSTPDHFYLWRKTSGTEQTAGSPDNTLDLNEWNCIIASCPSVGSNIDLYHGSESSSFASLTEQNTKAGTGALTSDVDTPVIFGTDATTPAGDPFDGVIGSVAIWNTALTSTQAAMYFYGQSEMLPLQIAPSNLVGYWTLDDEEDGTSADGDTFRNYASPGTGDGTGDDGAGNANLDALGESWLSYP